MSVHVLFMTNFNKLMFLELMNTRSLLVLFSFFKSIAFLFDAGRRQGWKDSVAYLGFQKGGGGNVRWPLVLTERGLHRPNQVFQFV